MTGAPALQAPAWQVSASVQPSPSLQAAPSAFTGLEQIPVPGWQTPASWHWSDAVQTTGLAPTHTPAWHESAGVQALPSLHAVPSIFAGFEQRPVPGLQIPES